jgi:hypothetical protein
MRLIALILLLVPTPALAGFNWGGDCSSGAGEFEQFVPHYQTATVGEIPEGKASVRIDLTAANDVDVQLIDVLTGAPIIEWPNGELSGPNEACTTWEDVEYCWSGYNGDGTPGGLGNEWIEIHGVTNRLLEMKAFGYAAGDAIVEYAWETTANCGEVGEGTFEQYIPLNATTTVGEIPTLKVNVEIELNAGGGDDVDIQLIDATNGTEIVAWPNGILNGSTEATTTYQGMEITWSGYNGIDGDWGHESIEINGATTRPLIMKAFGYQAGQATVDYEWGDGVGATCGGIAWLQCEDGLFCKAFQGPEVSDPAGACHTELWCGGNDSAINDCSNVMHIMTPGQWACVDYRCSWASCGQPVPGWNYVSTDPAQCALVRFACAEGESYFGGPCGCGCRPD